MKFDINKKTLLETFLDFTFALCICPFRIRAHGTDFVANVCTWRPQKILAGLVALLDIFGAITRIRLNLEQKLDNPVGYFNFLWSITGGLMHVSFYFVLWQKQHHILNTVRIFRKSFMEKHFKAKVPHDGLFGMCICSMTLFLAILPALKGSYLLPHPGPVSSEIHWTPWNILKAHIRHSKFMFFLSNQSEPIPNLNSSIMNGTDSGEAVGTMDIFLGIGHIMVYTGRYFGAYFIDLFMIISALTFWLGVHCFINESKLGVLSPRTGESNPIRVIEDSGTSGTLNLHSIVRKYADLKALANSINGAMSPILFCYVFEAIFYYATNLNSIFTANDWHARLIVAHFLIGCFTVFGFSADVTKKMDSFRQWLVSGAVGKVGQDDRLTALIHETQSKAIGVSAFGIFTIDYPLIFNIVTTTVTFFLIVVQFVPNTCES